MTRYFSLIPLVKSVADTQEAYYMANGMYTADWSELDIQVPASFKPLNATAFSYCNSLYETADGKVLFGLACNGGAPLGAQFSFRDNYSGYRIFFKNVQPALGKAGQNYCIVLFGSENKKVCAGLTGVEPLAGNWLGWIYPMP